MKYVVAVVERPDGTTYTQQVEVKDNETEDDALNRLQSILGRRYLVCDYYEMEEK